MKLDHVCSGQDGRGRRWRVVIFMSLLLKPKHIYCFQMLIVMCTILFGRRSILYTTGSMCVLLAQNEFTARDFLSPYNDWSYVCLYNLIGTKIAISCF
jgi:hypothetical protein